MILISPNLPVLRRPTKYRYFIEVTSHSYIRHLYILIYIQTTFIIEANSMNPDQAVPWEYI